MDPLKKFRMTKKDGPEARIQERVIAFLRMREWFVRATHGSEFQSGFPDLFASHRRYGQRWIEIKVKDAYSFTPAQRTEFPMFCSNGAGIWILVDATEEEYQKLFKPFNWWHYLK